MPEEMDQVVTCFKTSFKMPLYSNEPAQTQATDTIQWDQISQNTVAQCDVAAYLCSAKVIQCLIFHIPEMVHV